MTMKVNRTSSTYLSPQSEAIKTLLELISSNQFIENYCYFLLFVLCIYASVLRASAIRFSLNLLDIHFICTRRLKRLSPESKFT